ncbi:MAG TPA: hypothetical protein VF665_09860 [Longimicrobium sp.]|jgi:hypothetical protein|uniref:hypothetical protein n=1 Tax=Longimicrobium sp. TaxID=2029185 RepID=UPI002ED8F03B
MLNLQNRAAIALRLLDPEDRTAVDDAIARLQAQMEQGRGFSPFEGTQLSRLTDGFYLLRMEPWGILFTPESTGLVIDDIFPLERLEWMRGAARQPA